MWILIVILCILLFLAGLQYRMDVTHTEIVSAKVRKAVKICVLADLHCRRFGEKQSKITDVIEQENPDLIVIPGDLFDIGRDLEISFELIDQIRNRPVYYVPGNHDVYLKNLNELHQRLEEKGVKILEGTAELFQDLEIAGIRDMGYRANMKPAKANALWKTKKFRLLLCHRPDYVSFYEKLNCDLIICGHAHGGQWRIPFTHQGIIAPRQGLFPKYTEGVHQTGKAKMFVSRGLASGNPHIPRLYNNPEIAFITITPEEKQS